MLFLLADSQISDVMLVKQLSGSRSNRLPSKSNQCKLRIWQTGIGTCVSIVLVILNIIRFSLSLSLDSRKSSSWAKTLSLKPYSPQSTLSVLLPLNCWQSHICGQSISNVVANFVLIITHHTNKAIVFVSAASKIAIMSQHKTTSAYVCKWIQCDRPM